MSDNKLLRKRFSTEKGIFSVFHIICLIIFITGISLVYCNTNFKKGLHWMNSESYENSPIFMSKLEEDINTIFSYIRYKTIFEHNGKFDTKSEVFSINQGPGNDVIYTVEDIIAYAKQRGYYIDEAYHSESSLMSEADERDLDTSYLVNWRNLVEEEEDIKEPGEAFMTMRELIEESLEGLASYYEAYNKLVLQPNNIKYRLKYTDNVYTNDENLTEKTVLDYGKYAICRSKEIFIENNLLYVPDNLAYLASQSNKYIKGDYTIIIAVDTKYPDMDRYYYDSINYIRQRDLYFYGLVLIIIGLLGMFLSFVRLVMISGVPYKKASERILYSIDKVGVETNIFFCFSGIVLLMFLNDKVGIKLIHIFVKENNWSFAQRLIEYVIIYVCMLISFFSIVRNIKAGTIWNNSYTLKLKNKLISYLKTSELSKRLYIIFSIYCIGNIVLVSSIIILWIKEYTLIHRFIIIALIFVLFIFNTYVFHRIYKKSVETDKISLAIKNIADGDTGYHLDLEDFSGKEEVVAESINNIGKGLEEAIGEKVKSERLKTDLITNVSHDIKTPLTSIINYINLIKREEPKEEKIREYIKILEQKSLHLKNLTEDLVEASKASSGNMSIEMNDIDLVELVHQTNGEFEEKYSLRGLSIVSDLPKESIIIKADGRHLWRVLENIYSNAYKYAALDSRVYVKIDVKDKEAVFTIKNVSENPLNISPEELTERFVRGDVSRATEGSGLGLYIARSLTLLQDIGFDIQIDGDLFKVILYFKKSMETELDKTY